MAIALLKDRLVCDLGEGAVIMRPMLHKEREAWRGCVSEAARMANAVRRRVANANGMSVAEMDAALEGEDKALSARLTTEIASAATAEETEKDKAINDDLNRLIVRLMVGLKGFVAEDENGADVAVSLPEAEEERLDLFVKFPLEVQAKVRAFAMTHCSGLQRDDAGN